MTIRIVGREGNGMDAESFWQEVRRTWQVRRAASEWYRTHKTMEAWVEALSACHRFAYARRMYFRAYVPTWPEGFRIR